MKLVNILTAGRIPWIRINGPVFGYLISDGAARLLAADPSVMIEETTLEGARIAKERYYGIATEQKPTSGETINVTDDFSISVAPIEKSEEEPKSSEDSEIDAIIDKLNLGSQTEDIFQTQKAAAPTDIKKYTREDLVTKTRRELKAILRERGYIEGPNAGKYHDTLVQLIEKVLRTQ